MIISYLSKSFLLLGSVKFFFPIVVIGLVFRPRIFLAPTLLILFTIIFSAFLKQVFAVPFPPELVVRLGKNGFSFPSGHMQAATVFYGWFLLILPAQQNWLRAFLVLIIAGIGFGLIHEGYHNIFDVSGGVVFAALTIAAYRFSALRAQKWQEAIFARFHISHQNRFSDQLRAAVITMVAAWLLMLMMVLFYAPTPITISAVCLLNLIVIGLVVERIVKERRAKL